MLEGCARHERRDGKQVRPRFAKPESALGPRAHGGNEARIGGFHQGQQGHDHNSCRNRPNTKLQSACPITRTSVLAIREASIQMQMSSKRQQVFGGAEGEGGVGGASGRADAAGDRLAAPGSIRTRSVPGSARRWRVWSRYSRRAPSTGVRDHESEVRDLHAKIGELIVEREFFVARVRSMSRSERRAMVVRDHPALSPEPAMPPAVGRTFLALLRSRRGRAPRRSC